MGRQNLTPEGASFNQETRKHLSCKGRKESHRKKRQRVQALYTSRFGQHSGSFECANAVSPWGVKQELIPSLCHVIKVKQLRSFGDRCTSMASFLCTSTPFIWSFGEIITSHFLVHGPNWIPSGNSCMIYFLTKSFLTQQQMYVGMMYSRYLRLWYDPLNVRKQSEKSKS